MQTVEQVENAVRETLLGDGLSDQPLPHELRVNDLGEFIMVDLILADAADVGRTREVLEHRLGSSGIYLHVRSTWSIEEIGAPEIAYGPNGSPRAAILVPVTIRSGSAVQRITVAITKLAEMSFERILGRSPDPQTVARLVVEDKLSLGGSSAWDPNAEPWLEVTSASVADLSRSLRKIA